MTKVKFCCDSGANIHSCRSEEVDTVTGLGLEEGEWEAMTEKARNRMVEEWSWDCLEL